MCLKYIYIYKLNPLYVFVVIYIIQHEQKLLMFCVVLNRFETFAGHITRGIRTLVVTVAGVFCVTFDPCSITVYSTIAKRIFNQ